MKATVISLKKWNRYNRDKLVETLCQSYGIEVPSSPQERVELYESFTKQLLTEDVYGAQLASAMFGGGVDPGFGNLLKVVIGTAASTIPMITGGTKAILGAALGSIFPIRKDFFDKLKSERDTTISKIKSAVGYDAAMSEVRKNLNNYGNDLVIGSLLFSPESFFAGKIADGLPAFMTKATEITKDNIGGFFDTLNGIFGIAIAAQFKSTYEKLSKKGGKINSKDVFSQMGKEPGSAEYEDLKKKFKNAMSTIKNGEATAKTEVDKFKKELDDSLNKIKNATFDENQKRESFKAFEKFISLPENDSALTKENFETLKTKLVPELEKQFDELKKQLDFELTSKTPKT
jgi:CRISPR/Cas system CSM-associated protein Csm2 small subunit